MSGFVEGIWVHYGRLVCADQEISLSSMLLDHVDDANERRRSNTAEFIRVQIDSSAQSPSLSLNETQKHGRKEGNKDLNPLEDVC